MRSKGFWMTEKPKVSSFEPRRLREANHRLKRLEATWKHPSATIGNTPREVARPPGFLLRWWRMLFGE